MLTIKLDEKLAAEQGAEEIAASAHLAEAAEGGAPEIVTIRVPREVWGRYTRVCEAFGLDPEDEAATALQCWVDEALDTGFDTLASRDDFGTKMAIRVFGSVEAANAARGNLCFG